MAREKREKREKVEKIERVEKRGAPEVLFIPGCLLLGMGIGFLTDQLVAAMFIGLGVGFLLFLTFRMLRRK